MISPVENNYLSLWPGRMDTGISYFKLHNLLKIYINNLEHHAVC